MTNVIAELGNALKRDDVPAFRAGDTIKVHVKVVEGNRSRVQIFQGVVIRIHGLGHRPHLHRPQGLLRRRRRAHLPAELARSSSRSRSSPAVTCAARSSTTCATCAARPPRSRSAARPEPRPRPATG